jgi:hypothetical protein
MAVLSASLNGLMGRTLVRMSSHRGPLEKGMNLACASAASLGGEPRRANLMLGCLTPTAVPYHRIR